MSLLSILGSELENEEPGWLEGIGNYFSDVDFADYIPQGFTLDDFSDPIGDFASQLGNISTGVPSMSVQRDALSPGLGAYFPSQSYVDENGYVVNAPEEVAAGNGDVANRYEYKQDANGEVYIVDSYNGDAVGWLDENGQPRLYADVLEQNNFDAGRPLNYGTKSGAGVLNANPNSGGTQSSGLGSILKSVLDNAGTLAKIGGTGLKIADLLKNEPSNKLEPLNLSGVGPRSGPAAATVNWNAGKPREARKFYADGGPVRGAGLTSITIELADRLARQKGLLKGKDGGQDDVVDIKAAPGEYVLDAEFVSALGDGNTEAGARKLDQMRQNLRKHKRGGALSQIAPKAKNPAEYLKG